MLFSGFKAHVVSSARSQSCDAVTVLALGIATRTPFSSLGASNGFFFHSFSQHPKSSEPSLIPLLVFIIWLAKPTRYFGVLLYLWSTGTNPERQNQ